MSDKHYYLDGVPVKTGMLVFDPYEGKGTIIGFTETDTPIIVTFDHGGTKSYNAEGRRPGIFESQLHPIFGD